MAIKAAANKPAAKTDPLESLRNRLRGAADASGMTLQELGEAMGFSPASARQAASRLLRQGSGYDPRISTLLAFAKAVKRPLSEIL